MIGPMGARKEDDRNFSVDFASKGQYCEEVVLHNLEKHMT